MPVMDPPTRSVQLIPALLVLMLRELDKLPAIPGTPRPDILGFHTPTVADMESVKWLATWEGPRLEDNGIRMLAGLAGFRDVYDWHTASDVREIVTIRGSRRACTDLLRWMRDDAESHDRRIVGSFMEDNTGLAQLIARLGGAPTRRIVWEYLPKVN